MYQVGITGGIGSGKSMVCQVFQALGIPVFDADKEAKMLMESDVLLIAAIKKLLGEDAYCKGKLNREYIAASVFDNPALLQSLNQLVHPAVTQYGKQWIAHQHATYVVKEAALFFESGSHQEMNLMIGVSAPENLRIQRAMKRAGATETDIKKRMAQQLNEEEKMSRCHKVIVNDNKSSVLQQVMQIHKEILGMYD